MFRKDDQAMVIHRRTGNRNFRWEKETGDQNAAGPDGILPETLCFPAYRSDSFIEDSLYISFRFLLLCIPYMYCNLKWEKRDEKEDCRKNHTVLLIESNMVLMFSSILTGMDLVNKEEIDYTGINNIVL